MDPAIRQKVEAAAERLNVDLESHKRDKANLIAFVLGNRSVLHSFQARILFGAQRYIATQHQELLFMSFDYSPDTPAADLHLPRMLARKTSVRAVILGGTNSANLLTALEQRKIPFAVLGNNVIGPSDPTHVDAVYSDDVQGAADATSYLINSGHRDIWFIGDVNLPWFSRCAEGYQQSMVRAGLAPKVSAMHSNEDDLGFLATKSILSKGEPVTAILAGTDQIARGAYDAIKQSGLRIPRDISVIGFNDTDAASMTPALTSVREFPEELGRHLAELVLRRLSHPHSIPLQITIPTKLTHRESTRSVLAEEMAGDERVISV